MANIIKRIVFALALFTMTGSLTAVLPPSVVFEDTAAVVFVDLARVNPQTLNHAIAATGLDRVPFFNEEFDPDNLRQGLTEMAQMGIGQMYIALRIDSFDDKPIIVGVLLPASPGGMDEMIAKVKKEINEAEVKVEGNQAIIHEKDKPLPANPPPINTNGLPPCSNSPAMRRCDWRLCRKQLQQAFEQSVMSNDTKAPIVPLLRPLFYSHGGHIASTLGQSPSIKINLSMENTEQAAKYAQTVQGMMHIGAFMIVQEMDEKDDQARAKANQAFMDLIQAIKPVANGANVTMTADAPTIRKAVEQLTPPIEQAGASQQATLASTMRQIGVAIQVYMADHGHYPDRLEDLKAYLDGFDQIIKHPVTGKSPGFVYVKPGNRPADVKDPSRVVILYEAKDGKPDPNGCRGFVDGHVEGPKKQTQP